MTKPIWSRIVFWRATGELMKNEGEFRQIGHSGGRITIETITQPDGRRLYSRFLNVAFGAFLIDKVADLCHDILAQFDTQQVRVKGGMHSLFKALDDGSRQIRLLV